MMDSGFDPLSLSWDWIRNLEEERLDNREQSNTHIPLVPATAIDLHRFRPIQASLGAPKAVVYDAGMRASFQTNSQSLAENGYDSAKEGDGEHWTFCGNTTAYESYSHSTHSETWHTWKTPLTMMVVHILIHSWFLKVKEEQDCKLPFVFGFDVDFSNPVHYLTKCVQVAFHHW